jgi:hypothetical protein
MKKWLARISLGLFLFGVLLFGSVFFQSVVTVDVQDTRLHLARVNIPEGSNAFTVLLEATNHIWWPQKQESEITGLTRATNSNWDFSFAGLVLSNNTEALKEWDKALSMPDFQVPECKFEDGLEYLSGWKRLAQLVSIHENSLMRRGEDVEAFDGMVQQILMGRKMQNAHGVLLHYLVGAAVKEIGYAQMRYWAATARLTPEQLKNLISQIEPAPDEEVMAYANSMRMEYQLSVTIVDDLRRGKIIDPEAGKALRSARFVPEFNVSKTKAKLAKDFQLLMDAAPHHYNEVKPPVPVIPERPHYFLLLLGGNAIGEIMCELLEPVLDQAFARKVRSDVSLQATQTILALRACQLTHGKLPENLDALVPEFLDKVPVDAFNGQPLHYSAEKKIVYSVGKNLKDDGGDDRSNAGPDQNHLDLVFTFDF